MTAHNPSNSQIIGDAMRAWATTQSSGDPAVVELAVKVAQSSYAHGASVVDACCWSRNLVRSLNRGRIRLVG